MMGATQLAYEVAIYGTVGAFGGTAHYVYQAARRGKEFHGWAFIANVVLAFIVSFGVALWLGPDNEKREFFALVTGFFAYPILDAAEEHKELLIDKIKSSKRL